MNDVVTRVRHEVQDYFIAPAPRPPAARTQAAPDTTAGPERTDGGGEPTGLPLLLRALLLLTVPVLIIALVSGPIAVGLDDTIQTTASLAQVGS